MELTQEGQEAHVGGIKNFVVSLRWTSAVDFDLAAAYKAKDGRKGLCYFGDLGSLDDFPNMQLSGDDVIGGTGTTTKRRCAS